MTDPSRRPSLRSIQRVYSALSPIYDWLVPWISQRGRWIGLQWIDVQEGDHVLEVGVGTGLAFNTLLAKNHTGWTEGVDATPAMLARARRRAAQHEHNQYRLRPGDARNLPYPSKTFDAVFASYFIDVVPPGDRAAALAEINRVLKPEGRLVLVHLSPPQHPLERTWTVLSHLFPPLLGNASPLNVAPLLSRCNLSLVRQTTCVQLGLRSAIVEATPHGQH